MALFYKRFPKYIYINRYFDKFKLNYTIFYDIKQLIHVHVVKLETYESNIREHSYFLTGENLSHQFSEITHIKIFYNRSIK